MPPIAAPLAPPPAPTDRRGSATRERPVRAGTAALALGALGVVFGDIGTSPLYALETVFTATDGIGAPTEASVLGVISLVVWSIVLVVSVKYVAFILRADNDGEGGIMSLTALVRRLALRPARKAALVVLGVVGAARVYGDGMVTPAISVRSAMEGLEVAAPGLSSLVLPLTVVILVCLFAIQRFGTGLVGRLFGPVMLVWFAVLAVAGLREVLTEPGILRALLPTHGLRFLADEPTVGFFALGSIVLVVTGAEALYADMGHFGRPPIRRAWFLVVFPALTLNYLGQGGLILRDPAAIENPFFLLLPGWARVPMVLLATAATVIASQALISGAFSVTRQAVQLGFLPRLRIHHTSEHAVGQVFVPAVNWTLLAGVLAIVLGFGSSAGLASAYGVAVTGTFLFTTVLFLVVAHVRWGWSRWVVLASGALFVPVDLTFLGANLTKVASGGWLPLAIAAVAFVLLTTWQAGRRIVTRNRIAEEGPLQDFVEEVHAMVPPVTRVPGTAVFLNASPTTTPLAMRATVEHHHALHEHCLILSVETAGVPHVGVEDRLRVDHLGHDDDGIVHVSARFGFKDEQDVPAAVERVAAEGLAGPLDPATCSYFLSQMTIRATGSPGLAPWRKRLFIAISRHAASPVEFFGLPDDRTVTMGARVDL